MWHNRYCNSSEETRTLGCEPDCLLRSRFPETWESWHSKLFVVSHEGEEKLVSGFFVHYFQYKRSVCKVLGEVVNGKLDPKSKHVHRIDFDDIAAPSMNPAPGTPFVQRTARRQRQKAAERHAKRAEPGPIAHQTPLVAGPTPMQSNFGNPANDDHQQEAPAPGDQPDSDAVNWSWMLDQVPFPWVDESRTPPMMDGVQLQPVAPTAYNSPLSSRFQEPAITAVPGGFQFVQGMTLAEAYLQGFIAAQNQMGGS